MSKITVSLIGSLVGDGWMKLPGLLMLCRVYDVSVVSGTYALPVWEWGKRNLMGADYEIVDLVDDPDKEQPVMSPFTPGYGHPAMQAGVEHVKKLRPKDDVIGGDDIWTAYYKPVPTLPLKRSFPQGDWAAIQPFTKHVWKNCGNVVANVAYPLSVKALGFPGELTPWQGFGWEDLSGEAFDEQVAAVAGCKFFVGIGSAWSNVATLFHKPQIHVSYTKDLDQFTNPKMVKMFKPSIDALQAEVSKLAAA